MKMASGLSKEHGVVALVRSIHHTELTQHDIVGGAAAKSTRHKFAGWRMRKSVISRVFTKDSAARDSLPRDSFWPRARQRTTQVLDRMLCRACAFTAIQSAWPSSLADGVKQGKGTYAHTLKLTTVHLSMLLRRTPRAAEGGQVVGTQCRRHTCRACTTRVCEHRAERESERAVQR